MGVQLIERTASSLTKSLDLQELSLQYVMAVAGLASTLQTPSQTTAVCLSSRPRALFQRIGRHQYRVCRCAALGWQCPIGASRPESFPSL